MKYVCANCEAEFLGWSGRCPSCNAWGTLEEVEDTLRSTTKSSGKTSKNSNFTNNYPPASYTELSKISKNKENKETKRKTTGYNEFDRVLGGGLVEGEVVLISGEPGIGKSTLLIQVALKLAQTGEVLYVSGEESIVQIKSRIDRVNASIVAKTPGSKQNILLSDETNIDMVATLIEERKPDLVIIDSIQAVSSQNSRSFPGSISQIRMCGGIIVRTAKKLGVPILVVGQITKEGNIAGPKVLEHMVDCVVYMEGDEFHIYRMVRCMKNRFGATNEIGVFEMKQGGLEEVLDPSQMFMNNGKLTVGCAIAGIMKGSRVIFVEVQALTVDREYDGAPLRRVANGIKKPRLDMLCAVLSRRGGVYLGDKDVFVNVAGGLTVDEPSADLAICMAIKSAVKDSPVKPKTVYIGEVGLTGEVRNIWGTQNIINEAKRIGYKDIVTADIGSIKSLK